MKRIISSMKFKVLNTLAIRLFLIVLTATLPLLVLNISLARSEREDKSSQTSAAARHYAEMAVESYSQMTTDVDDVFSVIRSSIRFFQGDQEACSGFLAKLITGEAMYVNLLLAAGDGSIVCSALPQRDGFDAAVLRQIPYSDKFTRIKTGAALSPSAEITLAAWTGPGLEQEAAFIIAELQPTWITGLYTSLLQDYPQSVVLVLNSKGEMIFSTPKSAEIPSLLGSAIASGESIFQTKGSDGIERIYGIQGLDPELGPRNEYVVVGISTAAAQIEWDTILGMEILAAITALLIGLAAARFSSDWLVIRWLHPLISTAQRIKGGNMSARVGSLGNVAELNELAEAFDSMATAVEVRGDEIRRASAEYQNLFDRVPVGLYRTTPEGKILDANPAMVKMLDADSREVLIETQVPQLFVDPKDREQWKNAIADHEEIIDQEFQIKSLKGKALWVLDNARIVRSEDGAVLFYEGSLQEITTRKQVESKILNLAYHDSLTGLLNRKAFHEEMAQAFSGARRDGLELAVLFLDLDGFKAINDQYGHDAGDIILKTAAERLLKAVRTDDVVSRLGGDEFTLLAEMTRGQDVHEIGKRVLQALSKPILINDISIPITASIGASLFPGHSDDPETLLRLADNAMYVAKQAGKNRFCLYGQSAEANQVVKEPSRGRRG
jgi:diguanylate cyclase (GGDEF)-like protein/PAS domain S-box-containing protein